jgi:hypothetical protein
MRSQNKIVNVSPFHSVQTISSYKADGGNIFDPRINPDAVHAFGSRTLPPGVTTAADNAHHDQH